MIAQLQGKLAQLQKKVETHSKGLGVHSKSLSYADQLESMFEEELKCKEALTSEVSKLKNKCQSLEHENEQLTIQIATLKQGSQALQGS